MSITTSALSYVSFRDSLLAAYASCSVTAQHRQDYDRAAMELLREGKETPMWCLVEDSLAYGALLVKQAQVAYDKAVWQGKAATTTKEVTAKLSGFYDGEIVTLVFKKPMVDSGYTMSRAGAMDPKGRVWTGKWRPEFEEHALDHNPSGVSIQPTQYVVWG